MTKPGAGKSRGGQALLAPALPQVNLLPPEVRAARGLARTKALLLGLIGLTLLACVGLVAKGMLDEAAAADELEAAQAETARLQAEQARYAEVPLVLSELDRAKQARVLAMSTDILWRPYLSAIEAKTPVGARIETMKVMGSTTWTGPFAPVDPLAPEGAATITITGQAQSLVDVTTWENQLMEIPGVVEVVLSQNVLSDGRTILKYNVSGTITLSADAFSGRFLAQDDAEEGE